MATNVSGLTNLRQAFAGLKDEIKIRTSRRMVAAGGGVLRKEARRLAQQHGFKRSGALIRNIAIKRESKAPAGTTQYNLGVRHGRSLGNGKKVIKFLGVSKSGRVVVKRKNDPFYWRFLELGTKFINGESFIQQALLNKKTEAEAAMQSKLNQIIKKANKT